MLNVNISTTVIDGKGNAITTQDFEKSLFEFNDNYINKKIQRFSEYAKWILGDINKNLEEGKGLNNTSVAPLKESTIKKKGNSRVFVDKGKLLVGMKMQKIDDKNYKIYDSTGEGYFVQTGLSKGNTARIYFGASEEIKKMILDDINKME